MQQTQKYKLNLIESSDPFLPEALNQNTQKVEDLISAHQAGVAAELDARITKFTYGLYTRSTSVRGSYTVPLPFKPKAVVALCNPGSSGAGCLVAIDSFSASWSYNKITLGEDCFNATSEGLYCVYIAFG